MKLLTLFLKVQFYETFINYCDILDWTFLLQSVNFLTVEERKKKLKLFDKEAKYSESASRMQVPTDFKYQLEEAHYQICTFTIDRESGDYISQEKIKQIT